MACTEIEQGFIITVSKCICCMWSDVKVKSPKFPESEGPTQGLSGGYNEEERSLRSALEIFAQMQENSV